MKGRHLNELLLTETAVNYFAAYSILPGYLREAAFQPILCQFRSVAAHFAGPTADSGTDPRRFPSPFQLGRI